MEHLLGICVDSRVNVYILASTSVTTVQVTNLALNHTKRITLWAYKNSHFLSALLSGRFCCYLFTYTYKGDSDIPAPGEGLTLTQEPREHCCVTRSHVNVQMLSWNGAKGHILSSATFKFLDVSYTGKNGENFYLNIRKFRNYWV